MFFLDFETRSEADLPSVGSYQYASHPSTEALCCAFSYDGAKPSLWLPGTPHPFTDALASSETWVAHNVEFERNILRSCFGIEVPLSRWMDTAAMAARMSLPRKLSDLAHFFGLNAEAKAEGMVAIKALSRPRKPSKTNPDKWWTPETKPDLFTKLYARCVQDVELLVEVHRRLLPLEPSESHLWRTTLEMNERGIRVDVPSIDVAKSLLDEESARLGAEFEALAGCLPKSYVKLAEVLGLPDVRKPSIRRALKDPNLDARKRRIIEIFQVLSKSSVAKLDAMLDRAADDRRVRGGFMYCGADRTGRWSGSGVQPQNFPRGLGKETGLAFKAMHAGALGILYDGFSRPHPEPALSVTSTIANMLRGFLVGPFVVGDLAQIEARVLVWLAGEAKMVNLFATGGDPYKAMASVIYNKPEKEINKDERFMGKQAVLGAGYGLGSQGFIRMLDEVYDVHVTEDFAQQVVTAYRTANPAVVKMWARLQQGFLYTVAQHKSHVRILKNVNAGMITHEGTKYAWIELPSKRRLYYADPKLCDTKRGTAVEYYGRDRYSGGWNHIHTYGGKLAENIVQATSRDVLAQSMVALERAGFRLVATVHDEVVAEADPTKENEKKFYETMTRLPDWAEGLPLDAEVFSDVRYRK